MVLVEIDQNVPDNLGWVRKIRQSRLNSTFRRDQNNMTIGQQGEVVMNANGGNVTTCATGCCKLLVKLDSGQFPNCLPREIDFAHHRIRRIRTGPKKAYKEVSVG